MPIIKNNDYWNGYAVGLVGDWVHQLSENDGMCVDVKMFRGFMNGLVRECLPLDFVITEDLMIACMEEWAGEVKTIYEENRKIYISIGDYELAEQLVEEGDDTSQLYVATYDNGVVYYDVIEAGDLFSRKDDSDEEIIESPYGNANTECYCDQYNCQICCPNYLLKNK